MRFLLLFFTALCLFSCSRDKEPIDRFIGFEYPLDSMDQGKIFVFKSTTGHETRFAERTHVKEEGVDYMTEEAYNSTQRTSANKYRIIGNGREWVDAYFYIYDDPSSKEFTKTKLEIREMRNIRDQKKYSGFYGELHLVTPDKTSGETKITELFDRTDTLTILGRKTQVLIFSTEIIVHTRYRYLPFLSRDLTFRGENIYGADLGIVKFNTLGENGEFKEWELTEIQRMK